MSESSEAENQPKKLSENQPEIPGGNLKKSPPEGSLEEVASIYGHAGIVTFFTLLSRILGMTRDLVIAHRFGAGGETDSWVQAFRIPNALRRLTAEGSMTIAFIPIYVRVREEEGREAAILFSQKVLGLVLTITVLLCGLGMVLNEPITLIFSPGFAGHPEKFGLTAALIRWTFPYLVLVSLVAWAMGVLNSEGSFAGPAAAPILLNLGIIVAVLVFSGYFIPPVLAIAAGVLAGGTGQVILQLPFLRAKGARFTPRWGWGDSNVRSLFGLLVPSLFGVAVYEINIIVLGIIASFLPTGQIFHYHNGIRLTELVMGMFAFAFTTAGLPKLSEHQARQDWGRMSETVHFTFSAVLYTILPAMTGLIAVGPAIVAVLYLHGAYELGDVISTADTLRLLAVGMPAVACVRVMVPVFYAMGDARTPVVVSAATLVVTGGLGWYFSQLWEVPGLALGLSCGGWFQFILLSWLLKRKAVQLENWFPWKSLTRQGLLALGSGVIAWWIAGFGDWGGGFFQGMNWLIISLTVLGSGIFYFGGTLALGDPQALNWVRLFNRALGKLGAK